ncbi:MAG TPA: choice-of-anchor A family protein [Bryobacteraceae bacterium]
MVLQKTLFRTLFLGIAALLATSAASGASIPPYNAIVSGNFSDSCCDIGGGLAVGGNATLPSYMSVADAMNGELATAFPSSAMLIIAGTVTGGPAQLYAGDYYSPNGGVNNVGSGKSISSPDPVTFSTAFTQFQGESNQISTETPTCTTCVSGTGTLTITVNRVGLNIINLTTAELAGATSISFKAGTGVTFASNTTSYGNAWVLLNVPGISDTLNLSSGTWFNGSQQVGSTAYGAEDVLYNFYQATSLTFQGTIVGSVLAPGAAVTDNSGQQIDGSLVAASFAGSAEFHNLNFLGPTFTPEPAPAAFVGAGLIALALLRKHRRH